LHQQHKHDNVRKRVVSDVCCIMTFDDPPDLDGLPQ